MLVGGRVTREAPMRNVRLTALLASQVILWLRLSLVFKIFPITANARIDIPIESEPDRHERSVPFLLHPDDS